MLFLLLNHSQEKFAWEISTFALRSVRSSRIQCLLHDSRFSSLLESCWLFWYCFHIFKLDTRPTKEPFVKANILLFLNSFFL